MSLLGGELCMLLTDLYKAGLDVERGPMDCEHDPLYVQCGVFWETHYVTSRLPCIIFKILIFILLRELDELEAPTRRVERSQPVWFMTPSRQVGEP